MNDTPYLLIASRYFDNQIKSNIEKQHPAQCHSIGHYSLLERLKDSPSYLLTMLQYDPEEYKLNENVDLSASAIVSGDYIGSILQYSEDSIMICGEDYKTALILSNPSMQKTKSFSINTGVASDDYF